MDGGEPQLIEQGEDGEHPARAEDASSEGVGQKHDVHDERNRDDEKCKVARSHHGSPQDQHRLIPDGSVVELFSNYNLPLVEQRSYL